MEQFAVFALERHRIKTDGRGVTTLVALSKCPLSCRYCLNAELLKDGKTELLSQKELLERLLIDHCYFIYTNGGVTFGGGEPLLQSAQIKEFSEMCPKEWNITIETSLNVPWEYLEPLATERFAFIIDVKAMQPEIYKAYTGMENQRVIQNLKRLISQISTEQYVVKLPLIPEYTDEQKVQESKQILKQIGVPEENIAVFSYQC